MIKTLVLSLALAVLSGCTLVNSPNRRIVHTAGSITSVGVGENASTGLYELVIKHGQQTTTIVPVVFSTNANGTVTVTVPEVVDSYETTGANSIFGRGGITATFSSGSNAVTTLLGGAHLPVNDKAQTSGALSATIPK
jgi:hypothetical protein